jgi:hypothetical protein
MTTERQQNAFPDERGERTLVIVAGGSPDSLVGRFAVAGAAAMQVGGIVSDRIGRVHGGHGVHPLRGDFEDLVTETNPDVPYVWYGADEIPGAARELIGTFENAWLVFDAGDVDAMRGLLRRFDRGTRLGVLLPFVGPGGLAVLQASEPAAAAEAIADLSDAGRAGEAGAEISLVAAGVCVNAVMMGRDRVEHGVEQIAAYSLHRPRRTRDTESMGFEKLVAEVTRPVGPRAGWGNCRIMQVGGGGIGNFTALAAAWGGGGRMLVVDADREVDPSNLNRQILLVRGVGLPKAPVLATDLCWLDRAGSYEAAIRRVERPADLPDAPADVIIAAPDNDAARRVCADAARRRGVLFGCAGTSALGGQEVVCPRGGPCYECVAGRRATARTDDASGASCAQVQDDAVVASNMVTAGLLMSELTEARSGRPHQNVRFMGDRLGANRLGPMPTRVDCPHRAQMYAAG